APSSSRRRARQPVSPNWTVVDSAARSTGGGARGRRGGLVATPVLELAGISKRFGAVHALSDASLEVKSGEVMALVGDNGAGKSTMIKVIAGVNPADSGQVRFDGRPVSIGKPSDATGLGIATVYQDLALCDNLDVVANLFLGQEVTRVAV